MGTETEIEMELELKFRTGTETELKLAHTSGLRIGIELNHGTEIYLHDWLSLHPAWHKIGHIRDITADQSLSLVPTKLILMQQNQTSTNKPNGAIYIK